MIEVLKLIVKVYIKKGGITVLYCTVLYCTSSMCMPAMQCNAMLSISMLAIVGLDGRREQKEVL
jgi:hypothetical protein